MLRQLAKNILSPQNGVKKKGGEYIMTNYKRRLGTAIATVAILANGLMPAAFASTEIVISGNGSGSDNFVNVSQSSNTSVTQNNTANVTNNVSANAKTGGNDANFNTGGDVTIDTGKASVNTTVSNTLNSNAAEVNCCNGGNTNVTVSGNGAESNNTVVLDQNTNTSVNQKNTANVHNYVDADAKTGYNDANSNTGGDVTIKTGNASVDASVSTVANVNSARVSSPQGGSNPSASFLITGNGAGSDNFIDANLTKSTNVTQNNYAYVKNDIDADAKTGGNDANWNTGGDVTIDTGDASVDANVDNSVNFNFADVNCGCTWDVLAKIAGNGADEKGKDGNTIVLNLDSKQAVGQGNNAYLDNYLDDLDAKTGYNDANSNTGSVGDDPSVMTGNASVDSGVSNSGNVNSVGDLLPFDWPDFPSNVEFSFNFAALWALFGLSV